MDSKVRDFFKKIDWTNPKIFVTVAILVILPFVAKYFVLFGMLLGLVLSAAVLWVLDKCPNRVKEFIKKHPLVSDITLSTLAVVLVGSQFGEGLVLGFGAVFCTLVLSFTIPLLKTTTPEVSPQFA
jgi:hypothetical protein